MLLPVHRISILWMSRKKENVTLPGSHLLEDELCSCSSSGTDREIADTCFCVWYDVRGGAEENNDVRTNLVRQTGSSPSFPHPLSNLCGLSWDTSLAGTWPTPLNPIGCFQDYFLGKATCLRSLYFWWCFQLLLSQPSVLEVFIEANQACNTSKGMLVHVRHLTLKIPSLSTASVFPLYSESVV